MRMVTVPVTLKIWFLSYAPLTPAHKDIVMNCVKVAAAYCAGVEIEKADEGYGSGSSTPTSVLMMLMNGSARVEL
jgi:hypothetical protein